MATHYHQGGAHGYHGARHGRGQRTASKLNTKDCSEAYQAIIDEQNAEYAGVITEQYEEVTGAENC